MKTIKLLLIFTSLAICFVTNAKTETLNLISNVDMFDVGLAKINNDKYYDIYTINHQFAESYFIAQKEKFIESGLSLGLKQKIDMPDYEPTGRSPRTKNGLNIYSAARRQLVIYCKKCEKGVKGTIKFPVPKNVKNSIVVKHEESAKAIQKYVIKVGKPTMLMDFQIEKNGLLVLDIHYLDLNLEFEIDYPAEGIFLGENSVSPKANSFTISARDNHSFAWAKLNNDDSTDVFMTSGGLKSAIKDFHPASVTQGLLYIKDPITNTFVDKYKEARIYKKLCRTYRSEWVDIDSDGDLDLFLGCRNGLNQMNRQYGIGSGKFEDIAIDYNFAFHHGEEFEWIDWNHDNAIDLLIIQNDNFYVYKNKITKQQGPLIKKVQTFFDIGKDLTSVNSSIRTIDFNNNGSPEVFISTKETIHYYVLDESLKYQQKEITSLGLPVDISGFINFVDVDLDGYIDIVSYNQGIYLQNKSHTFKKTTLYPELFIKRKNNFKSLIWFDSDINGQWDVLHAESYNHSKTKDIKLFSYVYHDTLKWNTLNLHRNITKTENNWLQTDLEGTDFNRDAIGAKVMVKSKNGLQQTRFNHGISDTQHSQGHYRQYFGLNKQTKVDVTVVWPDGKVTNLKGIKANQLLVIKYDFKNVID